MLGWAGSKTPKVWAMEDEEGMGEKKKSGEVYGMDVGKAALEKDQESGRAGSMRWRVEPKCWGLGFR